MKILCNVAFLFLAAFMLHTAMNVEGETSLAERCGAEFIKLSTCLNYVAGKRDSPPKDCCSAAEELKNSDPACLCYFIEQAYNGSSQVRGIGVKVEKMLQLSTACQMKNATLSACPKLLGLSPSSPAATIFLNTSAPVTATPAASPGSSGAAAPLAQPNTKSSSTSNHLSFLYAFMLFVVFFVSV